MGVVGADVGTGVGGTYVVGAKVIGTSVIMVGHHPRGCGRRGSDRGYHPCGNQRDKGSNAQPQWAGIEGFTDNGCVGWLWLVHSWHDAISVHDATERKHN
eukprot:gene1669-777_t